MKKSVQVRYKFTGFQELKKKLDKGTLNKIGEQVINDVLENTAKGISSVKGWGKFAPYKGLTEVNKIRRLSAESKNARKQLKSKLAQAKADSKKAYPYTVMDKYPDKKTSPVNLKLSGKFLDALTYTTNINKGGLRIYFDDRLSEKKAETHNEGTQKDRVPQRKFLPTGKDDEFTVSIMQNILDIIRVKMDELVKKINKK